MTTRLFTVALALIFLAGCGGTSDTQKAAVVGWSIAHGGVVHLEGRSLEVKKLTDLPSGEFDIEKIDLTESDITDADLENFAALPELKALTLHSTKVTNAGLSQLHALKNLEELDLTNTNVSDDGLKILAEIKSLKKLHLHNTAVTNAGLKEFHTAVPECQLFPAKR